MPRIILPLIAFGIDALLMGFAVGGFDELRHHARAVALLGVWLMSNLTLSLLRPVRSQDKLQTARDAPLVMLVLFVIPLLAPPTSAWGETHGVWVFPWSALPAGMAAAITWGGVVITAAGLALRISAMRVLGARFSPQIAMQREHALETHGPYTHIRHPGYLGALLATGGAILAFGSLLAWPLFAIMLLAQHARASREEVFLELHFGAAWRAYRERTGRFLPGLGSHRRVG